MSEFIQRHIGPTPEEQSKMLDDLGVSTIDELVRQIVPDSILLRGDNDLPESCSEQQALTTGSLVLFLITINLSFAKVPARLTSISSPSFQFISPLRLV